MSTVVDWTGWLFMFGVVLWAIAQERKFLRQYLLEEVQNGLITPGQYQTAISAWAINMSQLNAIGSGHYKKTRRFYHLCAELAHKKRQCYQMGEETGNSRIIDQIRDELTQLRFVV